MQSRIGRAVCLLAIITLAAPVFAQYGYPLKGTFLGDWWIQKGKETHMSLEFNHERNVEGRPTDYPTKLDVASVSRAAIKELGYSHSNSSDLSGFIKS